MAFRADEEIKEGREHAEQYLLSHLTNLSPDEFEKVSQFSAILWINWGQ